MLSTAEIKEHLESRIYMPGWEFEVYEGKWEGQHVVIKAELPDSYNYGKDVVVHIHSMLPPMPDTDYLDTWMLWRLARIATHETREFYRDKKTGKAVDDPHAEGADEDR